MKKQKKQKRQKNRTVELKKVIKQYFNEIDDYNACINQIVIDVNRIIRNKGGIETDAVAVPFAKFNEIRELVNYLHDEINEDL